MTMPTLADLETRLDELERSRMSGIARVSYEGRTVEYRGLVEIDRAIAILKGQIAALGSKKPVRQVRLYQDGKGL
ncbi:MAG: hypothetical protein H7841_13930 [Magnetospirillum sp. WYHS-4]